MAVKSVAEFLEGFFLNANRGSKVSVNFEGESLTQQQWKEIVDVNNIVKKVTANAFNERWLKDLGDKVMEDAKIFGDVSNVPDLQASYEMMEKAKESFVNSIPSSVREQFDNDPMKFYKFASNAKNSVALHRMLSDVNNYVAPSVSQVEEGNNQAVISAVDSNAAKLHQNNGNKA